VVLIGNSNGFETVLEKAKLDGHDLHDIEIYIEKKISYVHSKIDLLPTINGLKTMEKCIARFENGASDSLSSSITMVK